MKKAVIIGLLLLIVGTIGWIVISNLIATAPGVTPTPGVTPPPTPSASWGWAHYTGGLAVIVLLIILVFGTYQAIQDGGSIPKWILYVCVTVLLAAGMLITLVDNVELISWFSDQQIAATDVVKNRSSINWGNFWVAIAMLAFIALMVLPNLNLGKEKK